MKIFLFSLIFLSAVVLKAQLLINTGITKEILVASFTGAGINVSNITIFGTANSSGTFINGNTTNLGIEDGALITTGSASNVAGPVSIQSNGTCNNTSYTDPSLLKLESKANKDGVSIDFDITPQCNQLSVGFVFGSQEYRTSQNFNDICGIFISGPDIIGQKNLALIPESNLPVSIKNVNSQTYSQYFIDNTAGTTIKYDGFTTKIIQSLNVLSCQSYHVRISIADAVDCYMDSGIFIDFLQCSSPSDITETCEITNIPNIGNTEASLLIYPNPTNGLFSIPNLKTNSTVNIYDMHGILVKTIPEADKNTFFDISKEQSGIYLIKVTTTEFQSLVYKLNKQ